ncbi:MAG: two-component histidine kinase [Gemmatimonadales bacterium]|nr:two-component histidine kinase [Gemmatimonadales bacterium]
MFIGPILPFTFFLGAVLVSAWFGGTRAGILALGLSIAVLTYVLRPPPFAFWGPSEFPPRIVVYTLSATVLLWMSARVRSAERALREANLELDAWATMRLKRTERLSRKRVLRARFRARLDERTRLAREIHDTLLQGFTGVSLQLLATMGREQISQECRSALGDVLMLAQKTLADARKAVWDMRPPALERSDFETSLRGAVEDALAGTSLAFDYVVRGEPRALEPNVETVVYRVMQAALANVVQHSAASRLRVTLSFRRRSVRLTVVDDGRGFLVEPDLRTYAGRWGLLGMRERASQLGGSLAIRSSPGEGTKVVLRVPTPAANALPDQGIVNENPDSGV